MKNLSKKDLEKVQGGNTFSYGGSDIDGCGMKDEIDNRGNVIKTEKTHHTNPYLSFAELK